MGLKMGMMLRHKHFTDVLVIGNGNDVEVKQVTGRAGLFSWTVCATGPSPSFVITKVSGVQQLYINDRLVEEFPGAKQKLDFVFERPLVVKVGGKISISAYETCVKCSKDVNVVHGLCPTCASAAGLKMCELCGRWESVISNGLCSVCSGALTFYPWVGDWKTCQYGVTVEGFEKECMKDIEITVDGSLHKIGPSICWNCPYLGSLLEEDGPLTMVKIIDKENIYAENDKVMVMVWGSAHRPVLRRHGTEVVRRIKYLVDRGYLVTTEEQLRDLKEFFGRFDDETVPSALAPKKTLPYVPKSTPVTVVSPGMGGLISKLFAKTKTKRAGRRAYWSSKGGGP